MPRNIKKVNDLQETINKKDFEIAKYKQLISSIQGLITINGLKLNEDDYINLLSDLPRDRKAETYKLSTDELAEVLSNRLQKNGYKLVIIKEKDKEINGALTTDLNNKEIQREIKEVSKNNNFTEQKKKEAEVADAKVKELLSFKKSEDKHEGKDGDEQYERLLEKEGQAPRKLEGTCPTCGEQLEAPIFRGYHKECYEAKEAREAEK